MKKIANFIVNKRGIVMSVIFLLAIICAFLMQQVEINSDMTKYLADDSSMKIGLDIMEDEFPEMESSQAIRVMFQDLEAEQKSEILSQLENIKYVDNVDYDAESEDHNKDNHTLYVLNTSYAYGSEEEVSIEDTLEENFEQYDMVYRNNDTAIDGVPVWILLAALGILMVILFLMCSSWIEPFLFLVTIMVAILINMGTNIFMGSVSNITFSIASILQLVLSMDYSIILMNRYRQEKAVDENKQEAMKKALAHAFSSITSSSVTTIVGLLALVFMSFKIGVDLGVVLAKGVLISMLCIFTFLPGLILISDKLIQKTAKKELHISMNKVAGFSYRFRHIISGVFVVMFVAFFILQGNTETAYMLANEDPIADVFPSTNTIVMVYDSQDEEKIAEIATQFEQDENIKEVMGYSTTLGKPYTVGELSDVIADMGSNMDLDPSLLGILYYDYYSGDDLSAIALSDFLEFISEDVLENKAFAEQMDEEIRDNIGMMEKFANPDTLQQSMSAEELAGLFEMETQVVEQLFMFYSAQSSTTVERMTLPVFVEFMINAAANPSMASSFDEATLQQLMFTQTIMEASLSGKTYTAEEMSALFAGVSDQLDSNTMELMYLYHASVNNSDPAWTMTIGTLFDYLTEDILPDERFADMIDADMRVSLEDAQSQLDEGIEQMKGPQYSRINLNTIYPEESEETTAFFEELTNTCEEQLTGEYHLIGNSAMTYEMQQSFNQEMLFITLLTAIAIFIVVAIAFRSLMIPAILVLLVQCGVYITVSIIGLQGYSIYFLALLIVECILMGATIDYGILFTNYYREKRKIMDVRESLREAYNGSIHTIMTSGLIIVLVVGIVGNFFSNPVIGQICKTLSTGALCASLLILFILPGLLATFDKLVIRKK